MQAEIPGEKLVSMGLRKIHFVPNPGNAGDALIAAATFQHFDEYGIEYAIGGLCETERDYQALCYGGGGNLVPEYHDASDWLQAASKSGLPVIVLPQTIKGHEELLIALGPRVHLFCRELVSYEYASLACPNANVYLSHDLALSLNVDGVLAKFPAAVRTLLRSPYKVEVIKKLKNYLLLRCFGDIHPPFRIKKDELRVFRGDVECTSIESKCDISSYFSVAALDEETAILSAGLLLYALRSFETVFTNRLHVCIAAALQGKQVRFFSNSYFKNEAVYAHSLRNFPNVHWMG